MAKQRIWAGLDVGEEQTRICLVGDGGDILLEKKASSLDAVLDVLAPFAAVAEVRVVLEAGMANHLTRRLRESGCPVTVIDTVTANRVLSIRRNKTDTNDARGLADLGRMLRKDAASVYVKSPEFQHLRSKLMTRDRMVKQRTSLDNSLRSLLREHGASPHAAPPKKGWRIALNEEVDRLGSEVGLDIRGEVKPLVDIRETLDRYVSWSDKDLLRLASSNSVTKRFLDIPGVGPITALSFYSAIEDPMRFPSVSNVGAYLGMTPRVKQSGASLQRGRITKAGNKLTRTHLVMAAGVLLSRAKTSTSIRDWGASIASRSGHSKAKVAVARKLAIVMLSLWKSGRDFAPYPAPASPVESAGLDPDHMSGANTQYQELGPSLQI